jgi:nucleotide-binding universal stress UspA family protein
MYKHILLPTDGSALSDKANVHAIGLAQALNARLTVFHASPEYPTPIVAEGIVLEPISLAEYEARAKEQAQNILGPVKRRAEAAGVQCDTLHKIAPIPWEAILEAARTVGADVIAMASHGRRGLAALILGSETQRVLLHADRPVLVVR